MTNEAHDHPDASDPRREHSSSPQAEPAPPSAHPGAPVAEGQPAEVLGQRSGIVAVVGRANVGKSSLVNALVGEKISIVSPVAQTTWHRIRGIRNDPRGQLVLVDTPGVLKAESELGRWINRSARRSVEGADAVMLVLDVAQPPREEDVGWMERLSRLSADRPLIFALNKCDLGRTHEADHRQAWDAAIRDRPSPPTPEWIACSATTGVGLDVLLDALYARLPMGPQLFPQDVLTDFPQKLFIADVVREKLCLRLKQELPHRVAVEVVKVNDAVDGGMDVDANIWVERSSQKAIVIGEKGRMLRAIRRAAEAELTQIYERPVRLHLYVVVKEKWTRNYWQLKALGLDL